MELHERIKSLRMESGETQKQLADYLGVDVTTYAHYEAGRRTPNAAKLKMLAEHYGLRNELLGASLPITVVQEFPEEDLDHLENTLQDTTWKKGDYEGNKMQYDRLKAAAEPVLHAWEESMSLPDIDVSMIRSGMEVKKVVIHQRANTLIDAYIRKTQEFWEYM